MFYSDFYAAAWMGQEGGDGWNYGQLADGPTRRRIKSSRDVGELVLNPMQLIRS